MTSVCRCCVLVYQGALSVRLSTFIYSSTCVCVCVCVPHATEMLLYFSMRDRSLPTELLLYFSMRDHSLFSMFVSVSVSGRTAVRLSIFIYN
jgi:hypothetical protein